MSFGKNAQLPSLLGKIGTLALALACAAMPAAAQESGSEGFGLITVLGGDGPGSYPGDRFRPAIDRQGILDVDSGSVGEHLDYDLGIWFDYAHNGVVAYSVSDTGGFPPGGTRQQFSLLQHRFNAHLQGAINLFDWVQLGFDLPFVPFQMRGPLPSGFNGAPFWSLGDAGSFTSGVGDLRLAPKIRILRAEDQFVDLAIIPNITIPTGFPAGVYMGEGFFTFVPEVALSREIFGLRLGTNIGYRARFIAKAINQDVGHEVTYRFGIGYKFHDLIQVPLTLDWTMSGAVGVWPLVDHVNQMPLETHAGVTFDILDRLQVFGGVGAGLLAGNSTPDGRLYTGVRYAPRSRDKDGDGLKDRDDACPDEAEDMDEVEDSDGCPDVDNDQDGILDVDDQCPNDAEDVDQFEDQDGCPDLDNDQDGHPDALDKCPLDPEDTDAFEDGDGCPDPDNDQDGVLDANDQCPLEPGVVEEQGCPIGDRDKDGLKDNDDKCPDQPEDVDNFQDEDGCPDPDNDQDGILDSSDKCPMAPEDKDGFEDVDGCPDPDNDHDGIADADDKCPLKPETINGNKDDDGCPDKGRTKVKLTKTKIEILDKVYFDTGKASIKSRSFNLLSQVASILKAYPEVERIRVEGHTDSKGNDDYNKDLSDRRAKSVRDFLVNKGIDPKRLEAKGFGEERPISTNNTRSGRAENRRVEFNIVKIDGKQTSGDQATIERTEEVAPKDDAKTPEGTSTEVELGSVKTEKTTNVRRRGTGDKTPPPANGNKGDATKTAPPKGN